MFQIGTEVLVAGTGSCVVEADADGPQIAVRELLGLDGHPSNVLRLVDRGLVMCDLEGDWQTSGDISWPRHCVRPHGHADLDPTSVHYFV